MFGMFLGFPTWPKLTRLLSEGRSLAQFARFAANDTRSYKSLAQKLGEADVPLQEEGWIPYCIPCIVQSLAGGIIGYVSPLGDEMHTDEQD